MRKYGLAPPSPNDGSDIHEALMVHAAASPIQVYSLAASIGLEATCLASSQLTLQTTFDTITQHDASRMGALYLRRLFFLHAGVVEALKRILSQVEQAHSLTSNCCSQETKRILERRWKRAIGTLLLDQRVHSVTPQTLAGSLGSVEAYAACAVCRAVLQRRVAQAAAAWAAVRKTI